MNYKKLGNTELNVSTICLGTMTWGEQNTQNEAFEQMDYSLDNGVNFWDTAELYAVPPKAETYGHTETIIGNWFEKTKKRKDIILASKVGGPSRKYMRNGENSFTGKNLENALHGSLKRLKTDYIDLYQLHWPERNVNNFGRLGYEHKENDWNKFEDVLENLKKFIEEGKIRYVGLSNENPWGIMKYLEYSKEGLPKMITIQNPYSLAKYQSYEIVKFYRNLYNIKAVTGILFNHESPLRDERFVTNKVIESAIKCKKDRSKKFKFGMIEIVRDWGWAEEYMEGIQKILNQSKLKDQIICTGKGISLKEFISLTYKKFDLDWKEHIVVDKKLIRKNEKKRVVGDPSFLYKDVGWKPQIFANEIIEKLILSNTI